MEEAQGALSPGKRGTKVPDRDEVWQHGQPLDERAGWKLRGTWFMLRPHL